MRFNKKKFTKNPSTKNQHPWVPGHERVLVTFISKLNAKINCFDFSMPAGSGQVQERVVNAFCQVESKPQNFMLSWHTFTNQADYEKAYTEIRSKVVVSQRR